MPLLNETYLQMCVKIVFVLYMNAITNINRRNTVVTCETQEVAFLYAEPDFVGQVME